MKKRKTKKLTNPKLPSFNPNEVDPGLKALRDFMMTNYRSTKFFIVLETLNPATGSPVMMRLSDGFRYRSNLDYVGMLTAAVKTIFDGVKQIAGFK